MKYFIKVIFTFITLSLMVNYVNAQNVQIGFPLHQEFISGQLAVYVQDGVTPDEAKSQFSDLSIVVSGVDITPVSATLHNPKKTVVDQIKNHLAIERYEIMDFKYDSTTVKDLKFADNMSELEKEEAREKFLNQKDQNMMFLTFKDKFTSWEAEATLSKIQGMGHFNLMSSQRIVYVEVEEGTESDQMKKIFSLPFVIDVTRVAKAVTLK